AFLRLHEVDRLGANAPRGVEGRHVDEMALDADAHPCVLGTQMLAELTGGARFGRERVRPRKELRGVPRHEPLPQLAQLRRERGAVELAERQRAHGPVETGWVAEASTRRTTPVGTP